MDVEARGTYGHGDDVGYGSSVEREMGGWW